MEMESYISRGGDYILLALFAQKYVFGQRYILSRSFDTVSHFKKALNYKKIVSQVIKKTESCVPYKSMADPSL